MVETTCIMIFTVEYALRLLTCGVITTIPRFVLDPLNVLDLVAIAPWYINLIVMAFVDDEGVTDAQKLLGVVRIVRLTRILRVFKASKSMKMMMVLSRTMQRSLFIIAILLFSVVGMMLLFGAILVVFERGVYNEHSRQYVLPSGSASPFLSIANAMYWAMATMTTVGYGDLYPETPMGHVVGIVTQLFGIIILSLPITVIGSTFTEEFDEQKRIAERERRLQSMAISNGTVAPPQTWKETMRNLVQTPKQRAATRKNLQAARHALLPPRAVPVPGYMQCEWLLGDFRAGAVNEIKTMIHKSETDLMRMSRKILIHSRVIPTIGDDEAAAPSDEGDGQKAAKPQALSEPPALEEATLTNVVEGPQASNSSIMEQASNCTAVEQVSNSSSVDQTS